VVSTARIRSISKENLNAMLMYSLGVPPPGLLHYTLMDAIKPAEADFSIAQSYISAFDRGQKEPGATTLFRIAWLYGKSIEWLLTGRDGEGR